MTKIVSRKELLTSKFFQVFEDTIEIENGDKHVHKNATRDPSVIVIPLDEEGNIYLIDQYRYLINSRVIEGISGMVEDGLTPLETAIKELKEEGGITAEEIKEIAVTKSAASIITWEQFIFIAKDLSFKDQELEDTEDIQLVKMSLEEAISMIMNGSIKTSSTINAILIVDKLKQQGKI